jgi:hypothetical protein
MKKTWVRLYTRFSRNLWNREFRIFKFDRMFATGPPIATPKAWKRASSRYLTCVAVRSRDLPQQRALTVDLSETGVCLETFSKVAVGVVMDLEMDLGPFPVSLRGEVVYCTSFSRGIYRVGLDFKHSRPNALHAVKLYLEENKSRGEVCA